MTATTRSATTFSSETGRLTSVVMKHAADAFVDAAAIARQWQALGFSGPPDIGAAVAEYDRLLDSLRAAGIDVRLLPRDARVTLDSIYVRDAAIVCERGLILCRMGKPARAAEPDALAACLTAVCPEIPVAGRIAAPGCLEGGDFLWLDATTAAVGRGYRTNAVGIAQLRALLGDGVELIEVPLPHWRGDGDVMHLMSLVSPVDADLAVVYSPLLPVPFRERLLERGIALVEVPPAEFETMGTNVLVIAPRRCVVLEGNPRTRAALERAGADVIAYDGGEISGKGAGGPTCLTRPLARTGR